MFPLLLVAIFLPLITPQNILIILLDDVDDIKETREKGFPNITDYFTANGVMFNNAFVTTPICCPSRASIYTGTYQHNHRTLDNTVVNGCDGPNWDYKVAPNSLGKRLQDLGYRTGMYGKYSNNYNGKKVPVGWDDWLGLEGNSQYYNYTVNRNGNREKHGLDYKKDYLPNLIFDAGISFMTDKSSKKPWCAFLSFPTAHETFDAAPQHQKLFQESTPPNIKYPTFNKTGNPGKHWYTRSRPPLNEYSALYNRQGWVRRLQALQSVNEGFLRILDKIDHKNTTIIFTSDNGFYFGEWGMVLDKRQPYEVTVRVPMFASGPHFPKGGTADSVVLNIDVAPTAIDVAKKSGAMMVKGKVEDYNLQFDGASMLSLLDSPQARNSFLVEYHGMGNGVDSSDGCAHLNMRCWYKDNTVWYTQPKFNIPDGKKFCFCVDSRNNTYTCERRVNNIQQSFSDSDPFTNFLYCSFSSGFNEYYNLHKDPWQEKNMWGTLSEDIKFELRSRIGRIRECRGFEECNQLEKSSFGIDTRF